MILVGRSPRTHELSTFFAYEHLPTQLQPISKTFHDAAERVISLVSDCEQLYLALQRLIDAKDAAVRAAL